LQQLVDDKKVKKEIALAQFVDLRLAGKNDLVKILGRGKLSAALKITAHKFTASAKAAIEAAGGEAIDA
jgi:large subunit ribosomal protein L15